MKPTISRRSSQAGADGGFADIFVMNADGTNVHVITATSLNENWPNWGIEPASP